MIGKFLASGELGKLASFVSPAFFDVMPSRALWAQGKALFAQSRDREAFRHAVAVRSAALQQALPAVVLEVDGATRHHAPSPQPVAPDWRAARVLELYFHQLFVGDVTLLDLRPTAFRAEGGHLIWHPHGWQIGWAPDFIAPLREMYTGFYAHDEALFRRGLRALSLEHSADLFRAQFGAGQATMRFSTSEFVRIFHQVFTRCKQAGTKLHPNFLALGIYLAALYDHLEELGVPVDVAAAFERVTAVPQPAAERLHA